MVLNIQAMLRGREVVLGLFGVTLVLTCLTLFSPPASSLQDNLPSLSSFYLPSYLPAQLAVTNGSAHPLEVLSQLYEDERVALLNDFDQNAAEALIRVPQGGLNADFNTYVARLEHFVDSYFNHSTFHQPLTHMLSRLVSAHPPTVESDFERTVYSWDKGGRDGVPPEFAYWDKRLAQEGWQIKVGDDESVEEWFEESIGEDGEERLDEEGARVTGPKRWREMWHGLGRPVLKSDILRYMMMLVKGGLYTDSDTAPLSDPNLWGTHAHDLTPRGLSSLSRAMRHLDPSHPSSKHIIPAFGIVDYDLADSEIEPEIADSSKEELDYASNPIADASKGINNKRVSLVISVEYDTHHPRQDPRFGYTRDLQIVQWTFMAKPFHPVFLDILETATTEIMSRRLHGETHDNWQSVLDVTGPGPFTDAVLRYLLIQYGVTPQELLGMEDGALIGDVLILPLHAFGSFPGGEEDWNAHDPSTRCTAHGFRGRWKGDMDFARKRSLRFK